MKDIADMMAFEMSRFTATFTNKADVDLFLGSFPHLANLVEQDNMPDFGWFTIELTTDHNDVDKIKAWFNTINKERGNV